MKALIVLVIALTLIATAQAQVKDGGVMPVEPVDAAITATAKDAYTMEAVVVTQKEVKQTVPYTKDFIDSQRAAIEASRKVFNDARDAEIAFLDKLDAKASELNIVKRPVETVEAVKPIEAVQPIEAVKP